ncbi:hypothetical protein F7725_002540 [Dissostichus mawsoni]|uniref:Nucleoporin NUP35 n=1 Tax=Dissostichus mawsoni TaxID=36200 RepID=A0A7J5Y3T2_DISMA|nr:hypothetical protein F7725_002540 [Dissostichus mawsoni]
MKIEMELQVGIEPMTLGSPTSPKPTPGAQFLPGFLMGDLPAPTTPQPTFQPGHLHDGEPRNTPSQGESLSSDDQLDQTWITVFGFPPASASYILLQFAQYGNILKHTMASPGNWMHLQYQSSLQARKALSKDGKVFGDAIMAAQRRLQVQGGRQRLPGVSRQTDAQERRQYGFQSHGVHVRLVTKHNASWDTCSLEGKRIHGQMDELIHYTVCERVCECVCESVCAEVISLLFIISIF